MTNYVKPYIKLLVADGETLLADTITEKNDDAEEGRIVFGAKDEMADDDVDIVTPTSVWDD